jgi:hypothetical protein
MMSRSARRQGQEVPLVFPSAGRAPLWQAVAPSSQEDAARFSYWQLASDVTASMTSPDSFYSLETEELANYASVTHLTAHATLTTSASLARPGSLVLTKLSADGRPALVTYFDVPAATNTTNAVLATFCCVLDIGTRVRLVVLQAPGRIVTWEVESATLEPASAIHALDIRQVLPSERDLSAATTTWLRPQAVRLLNPTVLVVAWTPWLVAVELPSSARATAVSLPWARSLTTDRMRLRQATFSRLLQRPIAWLAGNDDMVVVDMDAVVAIATAANRLVWTWHEDGALLLWTVDDQDPTQAYSVFDYTPDLPFRVDDMKGSLQMTAMAANNGSWSVALSVPLLKEAVLYVLEAGPPDEGKPDEASTSLVVTQLTLPIDATKAGLVTMQWSSNGDLHTLWKSEERTWQISYTAGNWDQPQATYGFLEGLSERDRLQTLDFTETVTSMACSQLEDALHQLDQRWLNHLLRPCRVRGTGSLVPPSPRVIQQALADLGVAAPPGSSSSVAVQVLVGLHALRTRDESRPRGSHTTTPLRRRVSTPAASAAIATPRSIYKSLQPTTTITTQPASPQRPVVISIAHQVCQHQERWKKFLLCVWKLEKEHRAPLAAAWQGADETAVLVRGDVVTVWTPAGEPPSVDGVRATLDNTVIRLLHALKDKPDESRKLVQLEDHVFEAIYSGRLALAPDAFLKDLEAALQEVGTATLWDETVLSPTNANDLVAGLQDPNTTVEYHVKEIQKLPFGYGLPGLALLPAAETGELSMGMASGEDIHSRLATHSLSVRCIDSMRRLMLGRFLVLKYLGAKPVIRKAALVGYLHSISLLLTGAQHVPAPAMKRGSGAVLPILIEDEAKSRPKKRPSIDNHVPSILEHPFGVSEKTTALDAFAIRVGRGSIGSNIGPPNLVAGPTLLTRAVFSGLYGHEETTSVGDHGLSELALLKLPTKQEVDHPRWALWLLSPALAVDSKFSERRISSIAQCLLLLAENESQNHGTAMAARAFSLLEFDFREMEQGIERIAKLRQYIGDRSRFVTDLLVLVEKAVTECTSHCDQGFLKRSESFSKLLSILFFTAIQAHNWSTAVDACMMHADGEVRVDHLKRLVRSMVDAGALADLVSACQNTDDSSGFFAEGVNLYGIAMEAFAQNGVRDWYSHSVRTEKPLTDYDGALFVLHATKREWKRAAKTLDLRFTKARRMLTTSPSTELSPDEADRRERLIVQDIVSSAIGCACLLDLVEEVDSAFLVAGEEGDYATLPLSLLGGIDKCLKRKIQGQLTQSDDLDRLRKYMPKSEVHARAVRAMAFQALHKDDALSADDANLFLGEASVTIETDQHLIDILFKRGLYEYGLLLGHELQVCYEGKLAGRGLFQDAVSHFACAYLIPLSLGKEVDAKTSARGLLSCLDALASSKTPVLTILASTNKASNSTPYAIREVASHVLRCLVTAYTTSTTPVATEVVDCFLSKHGPAPLPEWLHTLMVYGSTFDGEAPGLFARRPPKDQVGFLGNPSTLLSKYLVFGMYLQACRTVVETLEVHKRTRTATQRLPEKGDMDFVPYSKIDMLHNLMDVYIGKGVYSKVHVKALQQAQEQMVASLDRHFELLEISEMGLQSARALQN